MKVLKYVGCTLAALILGIVGLALVLPPASDIGTVFQTLTFHGKKVHLVRGGEGEIRFSASQEGDALVVNGQKLDLTASNEFTVAIYPDGRIGIRPGAP